MSSINKFFGSINLEIDTFLFNLKTPNTISFQKLISIFCIINLFFVYSDFVNVYAGGLINEKINNVFDKGYSPTLFWFESLFLKLNMTLDMSISLIISVYLLSLVLVSLNYFSLISSIVAWFIHITLINSSYFFSYGADFFITFTLFINIFFCYSNHIKKSIRKAQFNSFLIRFIQIHLCIVYFFSGFGKLMGYDWFTGDAIYYILYNNDSFFKNIISTKLFYMLIGWSVLILEVFYPVLIYYKRTKKATFIFIILLHVCIGFTMRLYSFASIMIILNFIAFSHVIFPNKLAIFYDNYCPNCTKFAKLVQKLDWLKLIQVKQLRNELHTKPFDNIDLQLAKQQMASFGTKWHYGYNSLYFIFARLPLFWLFMPLLYILKITKLGQLIYIEFALKRKIIPIHCDNESCNI